MRILLISGPLMRRYSLPLFALVLAPIVCAQTLRFSPGDPLRFGMGYNTLTGQYAGECMDDPAASDIQPAGAGEPSPGQLTKWEISDVEDIETLSDDLGISASASAGFIGGGVSVSTTYIRSKSFNSFHRYLYLDASVANATKVWTKPQLKPDMAALRAKDPLTFLNRCGNTFIQTITTGGDLSAIVDISTSAKEDYTSLSVAISGDYATVSGRASLKQALRDKILNRQTHVTVIRDGGVGALPSYSADDLIAASQTFPEAVAANPVPVFGDLASYDTVSSGASLTDAQQAFLDPLFRSYLRAMQYSGDLDYMRTHRSDFRVLSSPQHLAGMAARLPIRPEQPKTNDSESWKKFDEDLAGRTDMLAVLIDRKKQDVVSDVDFSYNDLDADTLNTTIAAYEDYVDTLKRLAERCLNTPRNGCSGQVPELPEKIQHVVRVFTLQPTWDTAAGPVSIVLDPAYVCQVEGITGNWRIGDAANAPIDSCSQLPRRFTNGYILTGGFDSYYQDNHGTCTYQLMCFRR